MYRAHYSLKELPFQMNMDPKFIWFGERHKDILAVLKYAAVDNEGFLLVTGDVGAGKTTLVNALLKCFDKNTVTANITNPKMEPRDFLDFVAHEFNIQQNSETESQQRRSMPVPSAVNAGPCSKPKNCSCLSR